MARILINAGTYCMKCKGELVENEDRCGERNCSCHKFHWVHKDTQEGECDLDTKIL